MKILVCPKCGKEYKADFLFCEDCGTKLIEKNGANDSGGTNPPKKKTEQNNNSSRKTIVICLLCFLAVAAVVAAVIFLSHNKNDGNADNETTVSAVQEETSHTETYSTSTSIWNPDNEITEAATETAAAEEAADAEAVEYLTFSTSTLAAQGENNYVSENLIDNDISTCWAEGVEGSGIGEKIVINSNKVFELNTITINNGYCKNQNLFEGNNRLKELKVTFDNGESIFLNFNDGYSNYKNVFEISPVKTSSVTVEIIDVYKGSKWDDTCISDIIFR